MIEKLGVSTWLGIINSVVVLCIIIALIIYKYGPPKYWGKKLPKLNNPNSTTTTAVIQRAMKDCQEKQNERHQDRGRNLDEIFRRLNVIDRELAGVKAVVERIQP